MQIPNFPDILSLLTRSGAAPRPADPTGAEPEQGQRPVDTLSLSNSPFDGSASSLEELLSQIPTPPGDNSGNVALASDGTYSPTVRMSRHFSAAFSFELNLSIRRETTLDSAQHLGPGQAAMRAREATGIAYRSSALASRSNLGGSFVESRKYQTELFYSRTRELSVRLDPAAARDFDSASSSVGRTFELDIKLSVSFLGQFIQQTEGISDLDTGLLRQYLGSTDALAGPSGTELQAFFDDVDRILEGAEQFMTEVLDTFLQQASDTFDLTQQETDALQQLVSGQVSDFLDEIDGFLVDARAALTGLERDSAPSLPETALQPTAESLPEPAPPPTPDSQAASIEEPTEAANPAEVEMA